MKIKRLDCPHYAEELHSSYDECDDDTVSLRSDYTRVFPMFHSDGTYLVNGVVRYEYKGEAWEPKNQELARGVFDYDMEDAEYKGVNILSKEQSDAIQTLVKVGLATDEQFRLFQRDYSKRVRARDTFKFNKRFNTDS